MTSEHNTSQNDEKINTFIKTVKENTSYHNMVKAIELLNAKYGNTKAPLILVYFVAIRNNIFIKDYIKYIINNFPDQVKLLSAEIKEIIGWDITNETQLFSYLFAGNKDE